MDIMFEVGAVDGDCWRRLNVAEDIGMQVVNVHEQGLPQLAWYSKQERTHKHCDHCSWLQSSVLPCVPRVPMHWRPN